MSNATSGPHWRLLLFLLIAALVLTPGCRLLDRSQVVQSTHMAVSGYAYDADLQPAGNAQLDLDVEVVRYRPFRRDAMMQLRGSGTLTLGSQKYRIVLPVVSPSFLSDQHDPCSDYFGGGHQTAFVGDQEAAIDLYVSESLTSAYGLIETKPTAGSSVELRGFSGVCFDEEGKTNWEIYRIKQPTPGLVAFTLGPDISPLGKLREYRNRGQ